MIMFVDIELKNGSIKLCHKNKYWQLQLTKHDKALKNMTHFNQTCHFSMQTRYFLINNGVFWNKQHFGMLIDTKKIR